MNYLLVHIINTSEYCDDPNLLVVPLTDERLETWKQRSKTAVDMNGIFCITWPDDDCYWCNKWILLENDEQLCKKVEDDGWVVTNYDMSLDLYDGEGCTSVSASLMKFHGDGSVTWASTGYRNAKYFSEGAPALYQVLAAKWK